MAETFQVWKLTVENGKADLQCNDGNGNFLLRQRIPLTDFPLSENTVWLVDGVALLPGEY